jgi:hypothetical protein
VRPHALAQRWNVNWKNVRPARQIETESLLFAHGDQGERDDSDYVTGAKPPPDASDLPLMN